MRRTYNSKKDAGGALDHRDVVLNMDEKSSVFDAFYIQNIKQTKRELSCVASSNHIGVASNRVRKRKYVKRIVKEVEPVRQRDTMSSTAYLTPDKSIRVNKVLDPFDMLLNSSSYNLDAPKVVNDQTFEEIMPKKESKTYTRKRQSKVKKFCDLSADSKYPESDKENTTDPQSNMTDIRKHELVIEKEPKASPKYLDESINKIVNNLSLHKINRKGLNGSFNTSYKCSRNRKQMLQSPILPKSPLCSTPFKEKYRGVSIFKFSPISQKEQEISPSLIILDEEKKGESNDSIILVGKAIGPKVHKKNQASPLTHLPYLSLNENEENFNAGKHEDTVQNEIEYIVDSKPQTNTLISEQSSFQTISGEPFLGFSNNNVEDITAVKNCLLECLKENDSTQENIDVQENNLKSSRTNENDFDEPSNSSNSIASNKSNTSQSSVNSQNSDKVSSYDTCNSEQSLCDIEHNREPVVAIERISNSVFMKYYEKMLTELHDEEMDEQTDNDEKYCEVMQAKSQDLEISAQTDDDDFESLANDSNEEVINNSLNTESDYVETNQNAIVITDSSTTEDVISNDEESNDDEAGANNEGERYVSFVTTRRKNEITNDSMFIFDNSYGSSSTDCDKTVLSNSKEKPNVNISGDISLGYSSVDVNTNKHDCVSENIKLIGSPCNARINRISSNLPRESILPSANVAYDTELLDDPHDKISRVSTRKSLKLPRKSVQDSAVSCDEKSLDSPLDAVTRISVRKSSKLPERQSITNRSSINCDEQVMHSPIKIISRMSTRNSRKSAKISSKLPRQNDIESANISNENEKIMDSQIDTNSRISGRKISELPRQSQSSSPELNASENEVTLMETNEANNNTVVESGSIETEPIDIESSDSISPLPTNTSNVFKDGNIKDQNERSSHCAELKQCIVLQPGKKWERSLSIYRRMTSAADHFDQSILEDECLQKKGRKYRQSVISTMEMQDRDSLHNDSINSRRSTFLSKPSRPTIRFVKDPNISISRVSLSTSSVFDDLKGFLNEECDDTVVELSKLSIADSEHEITILDNFHESERVATAKDYVLRRCNQTEPILFDECYPETVLKNCHKIGEGVYGEVFLWRGRDGRARVMKIVPIAGTIKVNGEDQKDFHEIISEIVIAMELSALRAPIADIERQLDEGNDIHELQLRAVENATDTFNEVLAVRCVYGPYPSRLLDLWDLYDECKGSENDSPAALPTDQRYIVLELANAGSDLESYQFASAQQAHALFQQIAFGLAVAEEAFQFEHRDLHWGNVLIAPTEQKLATFILRGRVYRVPRCGVAATIIDYSLSRLTLPLAADSAALYNDLAADEQLFDAVGDYQFEVYRLMRDKLGNDWKNFEPYTNILWLHYTVDKMITALRYKRTNTKIHKHYIEKLKGIKNRILEYGSAVQYVLTDIDF